MEALCAPDALKRLSPDWQIDNRIGIDLCPQIPTAAGAKFSPAVARRSAIAYGNRSYRFEDLLQTARNRQNLLQTVASCDRLRETATIGELLRVLAAPVRENRVSFFVQRDSHGRGVRIELGP